MVLVGLFFLFYFSGQNKPPTNKPVLEMNFMLLAVKNTFILLIVNDFFLLPLS